MVLGNCMSTCRRMKRTSFAQESRSTTDEWDLTQLNSFCTNKIIKQMKKATEWEIIVGYIFHRRSKIHKKLKNQRVKKANGPIKEWARDLNRVPNRK